MQNLFSTEENIFLQPKQLSILTFERDNCRSFATELAKKTGSRLFSFKKSYPSSPLNPYNEQKGNNHSFTL